MALLILCEWIFRIVTSGFQLVGLKFEDYLSAFFIIFTYLILFLYATFFELLWDGRTPGKRLLGLRVIREGGYPVNLVSSVIRNALRFIDIGLLPLSPPIMLFGAPALFCIFLSPRSKRIGDWAAGTVVIVESSVNPFAAKRELSLKSPQVESMLNHVRNIDNLSVEEYRVVRRFSERRAGLSLGVQAALGEHIAIPLIEKLFIQLPELKYQLQYADLVEAIERKYTEERSLL